MNEAGLSGCRVLVVEDDFYLASDASTALAARGVAVLGPFNDEDNALAFVEEASSRIDCALLDLNLGGGGPSFRLAHAMRARGIRFLFVTGYDRDVIPDEFSHVERLQKPYVDHALIEAVERLIRSDPAIVTDKC